MEEAMQKLQQDERYVKAMKSNCDHFTAEALLPPDAHAGKVVWITGASSGIGRELAEQLALHGSKLILSARREDILKDVAQKMKPALGANGEVRVLPLDLEDLDSLEGKAHEALSFFGTIDILVNNGGYTSRALGRETFGIKTDIRMMNVNFLSAVALAKAVLPSMITQKKGLFINISSLAGKFGSPLRTLYCGAKHAMMGWFDALRAEEAAFESGIRVTNVCPGSIKTDVAVNAVTADGSKRGYSDPNIDSGLDVKFACDRILAAAHCGIDEVWIAKPSELTSAYLAQYFPDAHKGMMKAASRQIISGTMGDDFLKSRL